MKNQKKERISKLQLFDRDFGDSDVKHTAIILGSLTNDQNSEQVQRFNQYLIGLRVINEELTLRAEIRQLRKMIHFERRDRLSAKLLKKPEHSYYG